MKTTTRSIVTKLLCPPLTTIALLLSTTHSVLAQDIWTGNDFASSTNWTDPANWQAGTAPLAYDSLTFSGNNLANSNGFPNGTAFDGVTFNTGPFNLMGNSILLSGQSAGNVTGIYNNSGGPETVGLNLGLDWGYYIMYDTGGGTALTGTLTPSLGSVAYFYGGVTSSTLTTDASGLIAGLGGAGLMYNGYTPFISAFSSPTGLATINGSGDIIGYTGWTTVATGNPIPSGAANNIELTANGVTGTYTTSGNTTVNTITAMQGGTQSDTLTIAASTTLTLGGTSGTGGIYMLNGNNGNPNLLTVAAGSGGALTAGTTSAGGTIVVAGYDPTPGAATYAPLVGTISAPITDNSAGGKVAVVKTGYSSVSFSSTGNTFSGGLYVLEGQYQAGNSWGAATGSIYVASGASLYYNNGANATDTHNWFLSPGTGFAADIATGSQGVMNPGALLLNHNVTFQSPGVITLLGPATSSSFSGTGAPTAGCRIIDGGTSGETHTFSGLITGPGTLDLAAIPNSVANYVLHNASGNNNWAGGLIVEAPLADPSSARTVQVTLLATGGNVLQIPHGPGYGNVMIYAGNTQSAYSATALATLNIENNNVTINGLYGYAASYPANVVVENSDNAGMCTLTMGDNNANGYYAGVVNDPNGDTALAKIGTGTQTFTAALSHHGPTTVSAGTFQMTGNATILSSTPITVAAGATLDASQLYNTGGLTVGTAQTLNCVGTVLGNTTINGTVESLDPIGTFANTGTLSLSGGATNVWYINNATGTAGSDPGWSLINASSTFQINATDVSPITIKVTSLTNTDVAGNAVNFNPLGTYSWPIAQAGIISGYTDPAQFNIITTGFANHPNSSSQWSVTTNTAQTQLLLTYDGFQVITTVLPATPLVVNQGNTATFTVTANSLGTSPAFTWTQDGNTLSSGGGTSVGGGTYTITSSDGGYTSTLQIMNVDASAPGATDSGAIAVTATETETANSSMHTSSDSEALTVIDAPYNPNVTQTGAQPNGNFGAYMGGGVAYLTATANGTQPFTYTWSLNGSVISGATNSVLPVDISSASAGSYIVVISNSAGMVSSSSTLMGPVTVVPNQMIFEPFDSYSTAGTFHQGTAQDTFSSAEGITNLFNQLTGEPVYWTVEGSTGNTEVLPNGLDAGAENQFGGEYPWPGLAGNSYNEFYWTTTTVTNHLLITHHGNTVFAPGGANTNIYFSFLMSVVSLGSGSFDGTQSVFGGFCTSNGPAACGLEFWTEDLSGGATEMLIGVGKGNGTTVNNPTSGVNINPPNVLWSPMNSSPLGNNVWSQQTILVAGCYTVVDGAGGTNDTVSLWINPPASSFYAATPPPPFLGPTSFGGTISNSVPQDFVLLNDYPPASHRITDLRIGTTWASVTPPSAPLLTLANQILTNSASSTVVFASQNAGNPVGGSYQWTVNGGSPLSDNGHYTGSQTSALTITGATAADVGTYTVTASNTDPAPSDNDATLTGSASALLTTNLPPLFISSSPANVTLSWPTNWAVALEATTNLNSPIQWMPVSSGRSSFIDWPAGSSALSGFPSTVAVSGTNYTATVASGSTNTLFFQLFPSP